MTAVQALDVRAPSRAQSRRFARQAELSFSRWKVPVDLLELGRRMRIIRERRHLSQSEVARRLECAKQSVSNWENATAPPMMVSFFKFCAVCDVDPAILVSTKYGHLFQE